ncbi:MAG: phosphotransferase enzyme family protein, partial [Pseudonocardiaceae bacterium]
MSDPIGAWPLAEGLMNRNWRVRTREGVWAIKQILDIDADSARRQHRITRALADRGLPVPPPRMSPDGDTVVELAGIGVFAALPWVEGVHRDGRDLDLRECRYLGGLLARIRRGLGSDGVADLLPTAPESQVITVTEAAKAKGKIDHYLGLIDARAEPDEFDHLVRRRLVERRDLLERVAYLRPDDTRPVAPIGWVHGDFHDLNLLWSTSQPSRVSAVLDWDRLRCAPLAAEVVRTATLIFGYDLSPELRALDLDRWLPDGLTNPGDQSEDVLAGTARPNALGEEPGTPPQSVPPRHLAIIPSGLLGDGQRVDLPVLDELPPHPYRPHQPAIQAAAGEEREERADHLVIQERDGTGTCGSNEKLLNLNTSPNPNGFRTEPALCKTRALCYALLLRG